jgi:hypothetical protein
MAAVWELIAEREAAATAAAETLREQIDKLSAELALVDTELTELAITRATLTKLIGVADAAAPVDAAVDATVASAPYQQILTVFTIASNTAGGLRAKDICQALDLDITARHTEGIRAKLKRLVARNILIETEPGLFTLAPTSPA